MAVGVVRVFPTRDRFDPLDVARPAVASLESEVPGTSGLRSSRRARLAQFRRVGSVRLPRVNSRRLAGPAELRALVVGLLGPGIFGIR